MKQLICPILSASLLAACGTSITPRVVTSGGRSIEIATAGVAAGPTVVFEAGLGADWTGWDAVASQVATKASVFAYSRPGYGASDPAATARDASHIVEELRGLLASQGLAPPYVLVGHSFGGTYMEVFAKQHPSEVAGVVLVDPRHRDFGRVCEEAGFELCSIPAAAVQGLPEVERAEVEGFVATSEEARAAGRFGRYPVRVLTATEHDGGPEKSALWVSMLGALAGEAEDGEQIVLEGVGHNIQLERPAAVAEAIVALLR